MADENTLLVDMGRRILNQRKQLHMSQEQLAELAGVSIKTVISAEKGKKALRPENIVKFCKILNLDVSYLMLGEVSHVDMLSELNSKERLAFQQIVEAFFSICGKNIEP